MGTATKQKVPNPHTSKLIPQLEVEVIFGGEQLGVIKVPQSDFLSGNGNVLFKGGVKRGWKLPGEPTAALAALTFKVNGVDAVISSKGVNITEPRIKDGKVVPSTGGEPVVCHTVSVDVNDDNDHMVMIVAKRLVRGKGANTYALRVQSMPRAIGVAGPQVVGAVDGLTIDFD